MVACSGQATDVTEAVPGVARRRRIPSHAERTHRRSAFAAPRAGGEIGSGEQVLSSLGRVHGSCIAATLLESAIAGMMPSRPGYRYAGVGACGVVGRYCKRETLQILQL